MDNLSKALLSHPAVYVTRDIERALGLPLDTPGYYSISNATPFAKQVAIANPNVLLIESNELLDTHELLERPETMAFIQKNHLEHILVFKNTSQIEALCKKHDWTLLNPSAAIGARVEEKISQVEWLGELATYLPQHHIDILKNIVWNNESFVVQFNRAHTGQGTFFIQSEQELKTLQEKFPDRPVRVTAFIDGPMLTSNNIVMHDRILIGNINYQITGLAPFTDQPFTTIGNDWALPKILLNNDLTDQYKKIATDVGNKLRADGWKGLFGIDVVLDHTANKLYLIEINARQPASTTYESQLQSIKTQEHEHIKTVTTFEAHLASLLDLNFNLDLTPINTGAQIILRVSTKTQNFNLKSIIVQLQSRGLTTIEYPNTKPGSDLLRIQSKESIMASHNQFNNLGKDIVQVLS